MKVTEVSQLSAGPFSWWKSAGAPTSMLQEGELCSLHFPSLSHVLSWTTAAVSSRGGCYRTAQRERCPRSLHAHFALQAVPDTEKVVSSSDG